MKILALAPLPKMSRPLQEDESTSLISRDSFGSDESGIKSSEDKADRRRKRRGIGGDSG